MSTVRLRRTGKARWEMADVFRLYGNFYRQYQAVSPMQSKVINAITACRTQVLGGHIEKCDRCAFSRPVYNSCRNRHCPKCQALTKARWLEAREQELLPVPTFHVVFTLPHEVNPLAWVNKKIVYDLLFESVSKTLGIFAKNELTGTLGMTCILHTWDQTLGDHLHIHCAIPAGALSFDKKRWNSSQKNFLFPVKALSRMFRGKFLAGLKTKKLHFIGRAQHLEQKKKFQCFIDQLYKKAFVVYSKPAFQGPKAVLDYIGHYTHRVAISNNRILNIQDQKVTFSYRDRKEGNRRKAMTLSSDEFIRRFLLHTLPPSFTRIRHFGFLANRSKKRDLAQCKQLLGEEIKIKEEKKTTLELMRSLTGQDLSRCPSCQTGTLSRTEEIPKRGIDSS